MTIDRLHPSLGQGILPLALWSTILLTAASCEKDALLPDARRAVLPSGDTVMIDCGDDIPRRSLPDAVRDAIAAEFPGWYIDEVERCDGGMGLTLYLVELDTDGDEYRYVLYTEDGTRLESWGDDDGWYDEDDDGWYDDDEWFISDAGDTVRVDCDDYVPVSDLPAAVTDAIAADYADHDIEEVERCDAAAGGPFWLVELETPAGNDIYVGFDAAGNAYRYVDRD